MRWLVTVLVLVASVPVWTESRAANNAPAFRSMQQKLEYIETNADRQPPAPKPTPITTEEFAAWLNGGGVTLPAGISDVQFSSVPAVITANARVDFDKLTAGVKSANPLLSIFSGVHDVVVTAQASGAQGTGSVRVESMTIDGVKVPRMAMQYAVDKYLKPKYPNVGLNSTFKLPARIDVAVVGNNVVTVTQK
jgi:hypothetical protein